MINVKRRRVAWRSHRRMCQVLFAFASAAIGLGVILLALYVHQRQIVMLGLGLFYLMLAAFLFGVRAILLHIDQLRHRKRYHGADRGMQVL
ncbi:MAG: hypothetical protein ACNA71_00580 [Kiritimatiellia bacterium]